MTIYHFNDKAYYSYADLCNAYRAAKGCFPTKAYSEIHTVTGGFHLYYR